MNKGRGIVFVTAVVILITGGVWLVPRVLAIYHQVQGGGILSQVMSVASEGDETAIPCTLPPLTDQASGTQLSHAISHLQTALNYNPKLAQADLLLGRAYCLRGEYEEAIQSYLAYTRLRPENPLGHLELAFGYQTGLGGLSGSRFSKTELRSLISTELIAAGIDTDQLIQEGSNAFLGQKYQAAASLFEMTASTGVTMSNLAVLQWDIAAILNEQSLRQHGGLTSVPVYIVSDTLQIEAEDMIWLRQGTTLGKPMRDFPSSNREAGIFWWNGVSIFMVQVVKPGEFRLTLSAKNTPPAPVKLQIEQNFTPIIILELTREDLSWQELETDLHLDIGLQLIGVNFINDGKVNGIDRNAVVDWIKLERK